jgi:SAM-dependent methyltransferase
LEEEAHKYLGDLNGKELLFYGCGVNWRQANEFYEGGSRITMIDISGSSISILQKKIKEMNRETFMIPLQMDCESLEVDANTFDLIYGRAILHHLNLKKALGEIIRVLRPGGRAVFLEPLGMNPIINFFRWLTPNIRTPYEHPLVEADFILMKELFGNVSHREFTLMALGGVALNVFLRAIKLPPIRLNWLNQMDLSLLEKFPSLRKYCWNTVLCLEKQ